VSIPIFIYGTVHIHSPSLIRSEVPLVRQGEGVGIRSQRGWGEGNTGGGRLGRLSIQVGGSNHRGKPGSLEPIVWRERMTVREGRGSEKGEDALAAIEEYSWWGGAAEKKVRWGGDPLRIR
jgi:hypothetical protein